MRWPGKRSSCASVAGSPSRRNRPETAPLFGLKSRDLAGKTPQAATRRLLAVNGTRMAQFPKKITDDPYGAAVLIRRLVMEQGIVYWRRYLTAFALMGVSAAATASSTYIL